MKSLSRSSRMMVIALLTLAVPAGFAVAAPGGKGGKSADHRQDASHRKDGQHGNKGGKSAGHRKDGQHANTGGKSAGHRKDSAKGANGSAHSNRDGSKHPHGR
jgi:hypothetical protein